jgi:soluble lytic murein transglycosylase
MNPATITAGAGGGKPGSTVPRSRRPLAALVLAALVLAVGGAGDGRAATADSLSASDLNLYRAAFHHAATEQWSEARSEAAGATERLPAKVILWLDLVRPQSGNGFADISAFIRANPAWPNQTGLERQAEATMPADLSAVEVRGWFAQHAPVSAAGISRYAEALTAGGDGSRAAELVRRFWADANFVSVDDETGFRGRFGGLLRASDHLARLDRLLWDHQSTAARRLLPLVDPDHQALALARIALADDLPGPEAALARVPGSLTGDAGLAYERVHWRRHKGDDDAALEGLRNPPAQLGRPALWWTERNIEARRLMARQETAQAYHLVAAHGLTEGQPLAEAEFLAGWLALRVLHLPSEAFQHFHRVYQAVTTPMSRARGAYWCGRAAEALGDHHQARQWYAAAARFPTMFYGQLGAAALGGDHPPALPPEPAVSEADATGFNHRELVRVVRLLHEIDPADTGGHTGLFLRRLIKESEGAAQYALLARLAEEVRHPDLAIAVAKQALPTGTTLIAQGYPVLAVPPQGGVEPALALAVIRQESTFNTTTVSSAGARGLMQLMPPTAQQVAGKLGLPHDDVRLTADPGYNILLGTSYLRQLVDGYGGSYLLAVAAYNAGSGRVREWLDTAGDPRAGGGVDPLDWVESIPIAETRNYVQRVLEALEVYRVRLGKADGGLTLKQDLAR